MNTIPERRCLAAGLGAGDQMMGEQGASDMTLLNSPFGLQRRDQFQMRDSDTSVPGFSNYLQRQASIVQHSDHHPVVSSRYSTVVITTMSQPGTKSERNLQTWRKKKLWNVESDIEHGKFLMRIVSGCDFLMDFRCDTVTGTMDRESGRATALIKVGLGLPLDTVTGRKTRFSWWSGRSENKG